MKKIIQVAHRGLFTRDYPENGKTALIKAFTHARVDGVECDLRMTMDRQIVIQHDDHLKRVFRVNDYLSKNRHSILKENLPELCSLSFLLTELKAMTLKTTKVLILEVKEAEVFNLLDPFKNDLLNLQTGFVDFCVSSFLHEELFDFQGRNPEIKTAALFSELPKSLDECLKRDYHFCQSLHVQSGSLDDDNLKIIQQNNKTVYAWTVKDRAEADRLITLGVEGLIAENIF